MRLLVLFAVKFGASYPDQVTDFERNVCGHLELEIGSRMFAIFIGSMVKQLGGHKLLAWTILANGFKFFAEREFVAGGDFIFSRCQNLIDHTCKDVVANQTAIEPLRIFIQLTEEETRGVIAVATRIKFVDPLLRCGKRLATYNEIACLAVNFGGGRSVENAAIFKLVMPASTILSRKSMVHKSFEL